MQDDNDSRPARRVRPTDGSGALGDVIARAESLGIQVFTKKDSPFEDVMVVKDGPHRVIVVLGDVMESLAALWIRWALSEEELAV
ncbi:MAG: hypothetical protein AB8H86_18490 [Polyangiales bacterium]